MDFRILGPLEVFHEGRAVPVAGSRQRELLALLLLDAGRVISTDRLMDELWGERQPAAGVTALRVRVSQLRKALRAGGDVVVTRPPGYALLVPRGGLDLWRFERDLTEGERLVATDPARAVDALARALGEWRGAPLSEPCRCHTGPRQRTARHERHHRSARTTLSGHVRPCTAPAAAAAPTPVAGGE